MYVCTYIFTQNVTMIINSFTKYLNNSEYGYRWVCKYPWRWKFNRAVSRSVLWLSVMELKTVCKWADLATVCSSNSAGSCGGGGCLILCRSEVCLLTPDSYCFSDLFMLFLEGCHLVVVCPVTGPSRHSHMWLHQQTYFYMIPLKLTASWHACMRFSPSAKPWSSCGSFDYV